MKNWKDYVSFQPLNYQETFPDRAPAFYLEAVESGFEIKRHLLDEEDFKYNEDEISDVVEKELLTFPVYDEWIPFVGENSTNDDKEEILKTINVNRVNCHIAKKSKRGAGNTIIKINNSDVFMYKGSSADDNCIIVSQFKDKYAIFKHPRFDSYGFVVNEEV